MQMFTVADGLTTIRWFQLRSYGHRSPL